MSSEFKVLQVKFHTAHELYIKQHKTREDTNARPSDKTLLVGNVPPYCTKVWLKHLFRKCGVVKDVQFSLPKNAGVVCNEPSSDFFPSWTYELNGYRIAYVVFVSPEGLENALNSTASIEPSGKSPLITGYEKWHSTYSRVPDRNQLQSEIDQYMQNYDETVQKRTSKEKKSAVEPNKDGWVTVTKSGRRPGFARKQMKLDGEVKLGKKKKKRELLNFYSFQIKESKMKHLSQLRDRFEKDKKKIEELKARRKFKPF